MDIFVAEFSRHGRPNLVSMGVLKETAKTYKVLPGSGNSIIGYDYQRSVINKAYDAVFLTEEEAVEWLLERALDYIKICQTALGWANNQYDELFDRQKALLDTPTEQGV